MNPEKLCPRYDRCSVNNCPLTIAYPDQVKCAEDAQQKCPMEKNVRKRIAAQFPKGTLKYEGMTPSEYSALMRFELMSPAQKSQMAEAGRSRPKKYQDSQQGKKFQN